MRVFLMGISLAAACSVCSIAQEKKRWGQQNL